ncbi:hypothetical protein ET445_15020 [Agromyces protaetiae]|uniref:4'-phosphopantetheinyl transferase superfamily protein n=1 Tax=Agromyces protaetiae TaxID=2509455 RepID=A0A4P6FET6_9MICO|nr:4'-phosphopantetheinyl transferase superfamily protein [Agromyces protaetiae]QAY74444.1 hypothetical protein ET445_15020 [Agromyces protaetiae]
MEDAAGEATWVLEAHGLTLVRVPTRRQPSTDHTLRQLIARVATVPTDDVELSWRCPECGARHGTPTVEYPVRGSGAPWYADAVSAAGVVYAGAGSKHPFALAMTVEPLVAQVVDEVSFHANEIAWLATLDDAERSAQRTAVWARKAALARALRHRTFLEPARIELTPADDRGIARLARSVPEFGTSWSKIELHDLPSADGFAVAVAVLPSAR